MAHVRAHTLRTWARAHTACTANAMMCDAHTQLPALPAVSAVLLPPKLSTLLYLNVNYQRVTTAYPKLCHKHAQHQSSIPTLNPDSVIYCIH